ncbi:hypothetical protein AVEN_90960-1, partial [Araneus ventricosus]
MTGRQMRFQYFHDKASAPDGWLVWDLLAQEPNLDMLRQTYGESAACGAGPDSAVTLTT